MRGQYHKDDFGKVNVPTVERQDLAMSLWGILVRFALHRAGAGQL